MTNKKKKEANNIEFIDFRKKQEEHRKYIISIWKENLDKLVALAVAIIWYYIFCEIDILIRYDALPKYSISSDRGNYGPLFPLIGLICVWFGNQMGNIVAKNPLPGFGSFVSIDNPSPGWLVKFVGWLFLIVFTPIFILIISHK
jgi:hypothetical protein